MSECVRFLSVSECAVIAATTHQPSYYNPIRHPENNRYRRDLILSQMREQGYLSENEFERAMAEPLTLRVSEKPLAEQIRSWYVDMTLEDVIRDLCAEYGVSRSEASLWVHGGGLRIDLAMDPEIQAAVEEHYRTAVRLPTNAQGETAQSALILKARLPASRLLPF